MLVIFKILKVLYFKFTLALICLAVHVNHLDLSITKLGCLCIYLVSNFECFHLVIILAEVVGKLPTIKRISFETPASTNHTLSLGILRTARAP